MRGTQRAVTLITVATAALALPATTAVAATSVPPAPRTAPAVTVALPHFRASFRETPHPFTCNDRGTCHGIITGAGHATKLGQVRQVIHETAMLGHFPPRVPATETATWVTSVGKLLLAGRSRACLKPNNPTVATLIRHWVIVGGTGVLGDATGRVTETAIEHPGGRYIVTHARGSIVY